MSFKLCFYEFHLSKLDDSIVTAPRSHGYNDQFSNNVNKLTSPSLRTVLGSELRPTIWNESAGA